MASAAKPSLAMRLVAVMQVMGIEGLPRNYELVYEAYTGADKELTKAFKALGPKKTQESLDQLGRKFLPHHFESGNLETHTARVKDEMQAFLDILEEERSSLAEFNGLVGAAIEGLATGSPDTDAATRSMEALSFATRQRQERAQIITRQVSLQAATLEAVKEEVASAEQQKFTDPLTGLGNRRMFIKELATLSKEQVMPVPFGVSVVEIDNYDKYAEKNLIKGDYIKGFSVYLRNAAAQAALLCRFDGGRFGIIWQEASADAVSKHAGHIQRVIGETRALRGITVSIGNCMSADAGNGLDIVTLAEKALRSGQKSGAGSVIFHAAPTHGKGRNFTIYEASGV